MHTQPGYKMPMTIRDVVTSIKNLHFLLPAIQREFVWKTHQIAKLFDSLMQGYPIGSFLFWKIEEATKSKFQFYEFIRNYHERDIRHNPKANIIGQNNITAILDGQQRFTSLYIGLRGTYASKIPRKRWDNDKAFPKKKLFLNIAHESNDFNMKFEFKFLSTKEIKNDENHHWFEVGKIIEFKNLRDINQYLRENNLIENSFSDEALFALFEVITKNKIINYYEETTQEIDKVLNIFIRVNSGGTILSYSDLLLSIATAEWKSKDARNEIISFVDELNDIGNGFSFTKDFVLKSCLVLSELDIRFKVENFNKKNMKKIEILWDDITISLRICVKLLSNFGYSYKTLTSLNAIIPIAQYIYNLKNPDNFTSHLNYSKDRNKIKKWLSLVLIKRQFSGQPDNILRPIRRIVKSNPKGFPLQELVDEFKGTTKSLIFNPDDIANLLHTKYGNAHTFTIVSLFYPNLDYRNIFHTDHIFPKSFFSHSQLGKKGIPVEKMDEFIDNHNYLGNLQLLEGVLNEEKSNKEFEIWLKEYCEGDKTKIKDFKTKNLIPQEISLTFNNFLNFFQEREELIIEKLSFLLEPEYYS